MCNFAHLHVHSEYSTLDGMGRVKELINTAKSLGQNAIAITDHGTASGLWEAQKYGDELGVKIIHGCEFYYESEYDNSKNAHLLILAKNDEGLRNIFRMQEYSYVHNFYKKARINWDILKEHKEGLIVTSACLGSPFNQFLINGDVVGATEWARKFKEEFGEDFYIELQPNSIPEQLVANQGSIRIAEKLDIDIVATNDVHYTFETDCFPHEVLLAMQIKKKMSDEKRFKFPADDFWLKSKEEMYETFNGLPQKIVERAITNTQIIADKCDARIKKGHYLPEYYNIPEGETERDLLVKKVMQGARNKELVKDKEFMSDVQHEVNVIDEEGYSGYFLIVQDYINSAREKGIIVGDGRGSGSGSKVGYLTDIHKIPPHQFDLLFERFMAKGREPDIDTDFSDQIAVFRDLQKKYGKYNVARIVAFGRMTPRSVIRKVLNAFEHPMHIIGRITKLVDNLKHKTLEQAYEDVPELLEYKKKYKVEWDVIERLQNVISHESKHAGGVIIYPNLSDHLPLKWDRDEEILVAGFDKVMLEELGHFKFDVLGLETLPVVRATLDSIKSTEGIDIDLHEVDYEDQEVYDMLCRGDVSGVFQINQQAQKVMEQQPRNFKDLIAINALIRPGVGDWEEYLARRKGERSFEIHPHRKSYMEETVGTMTYQEQFLLDAVTFAGWGVAYADKHIRKNKDIRNDEALRNKFLEDGESNGYAIDTLHEIWKEIEDAVDGGYSFNKSHSASYAMISYQTAWLKCKYPEHFYASLMSGEKTDGDGQDAIAGYIAECKQRGIHILPPDINNSGEHFNVANGGINYRITTIKHVGDSAIQHIHELRPISSFSDFMERREKKFIKKNVMVNLIKAGAFDFDEPNRAKLLWEFEMSQRTKTQIKNEEEVPMHEWNDRVKCEWEKEVLGMYLSVHPMERYGFKPLDAYDDKGQCLQGGEVYDVKEFKDRNGNLMAFVFINTLFGNVKLLCFASTWKDEAIKSQLKLNNLVLIRGRRSGKDVLVDSVEVLG